LTFWQKKFRPKNLTTLFISLKVAQCPRDTKKYFRSMAY
jgi:hypothetical protein